MSTQDVQTHPPTRSLSYVEGPKYPPLLDLTSGRFIDSQAEQYGPRPAVIVPWTGACLSFLDLKQRTREVARSLIAQGIGRGDKIAILCGDDERFIELFFACGRIGAVLVILNKTYTPIECERALMHTEPSVLFISDIVNHKNTAPIKQHLKAKATSLKVTNLVYIRQNENEITSSPTGTSSSWEAFLAAGRNISSAQLTDIESRVESGDVTNLQFTSGTTGDPKAVMLSHYNMINNGRFIGDCLELTADDIICCPPPLFHCFGLVAGLLAAMTHGSSIIYSSRDFDPDAIADALVKERCTVLHGVPTMFTAILGALEKKNVELRSIRTGIAAGTKVPPPLLGELREKLGFRDTCICYGMTETSPASFMTVASDSLEAKLETVGTILPHTKAKVVNKEGQILPRGARGELCISGYLLQQGYYKNPSKTAEAMIRDEDGTLWMYTGDEAFIDEKGYCSITGRIKDMIIRGGENIYPQEIEERLLQHSAISQAAIVGVQDSKYGEAIAAFLGCRSGTFRPSLEELRSWVRQVLAPHKAPAHLFWVGPDESVTEFPMTGSGKFRKEVLRAIGNQLREQRSALRDYKL